MKVVVKTKEKIEKDDSLFGLLLQHKRYVTYLRILVNETEKHMSLQLSDNPRNWNNLPQEKYSTYKMLSRNDIGVIRFSVKYLSPEQVLSFFTPTFGVKFVTNKYVIDNSLSDPKKRYFTLDCQLKYVSPIVECFRKIVALSAQKKYEIIETCLSAERGNGNH